MTLAVHRDWQAIPPEARGAAVALGNLDGVHRGHAHLISTLHKARPDLPLGVLTFEPHPRALFRPQDPPFRLSHPAERDAALAALGVRFVYALPFDAAFAAMSAAEFVGRVLHEGLGARHLACGADFGFGRRRGGDVGMLAAEAERLGIGLTVVPALGDARGPYSSTRVRRELQDGYPERAAELLGRPWSVRGEVIHGDKRGRQLGFPTANIALGEHVEPARGVYAVRVTLPDGRVIGGVANIGRRPTIADGTQSRLEVHLFDFDADLYGQELTVSLIAMLRPETRFASLDELRAQIARDSDAARAVLETR